MKDEFSATELRLVENYLKGYLFSAKLLRLDRYEKQYFSDKISEWEAEAPGELPLARTKMFEVRHFIMSLKNGDEKLLLYYHYIKDEPIERCAELLGISRSSAFRIRKRALGMAYRAYAEKAEKAEKDLPGQVFGV